jgi:hypothetical protein
LPSRATLFVYRKLFGEDRCRRSDPIADVELQLGRTNTVRLWLPMFVDGAEYPPLNVWIVPLSVKSSVAGGTDVGRCTIAPGRA